RFSRVHGDPSGRPRQCRLNTDSRREHGGDNSCFCMPFLAGLLAKPVSAPAPAKLSRASARRMLALARPERKRLLAGTVFLVVGSGATLLFPQGVRQVLDDAIKGVDAATIDREALFMAIVSLVLGVSVALRFVL